MATMANRGAVLPQTRILEFPFFFQVDTNH